MRRVLCGAVRGLLAGTGLTVGLSSPAFAQLPPAARPVVVGVADPNAPVPGDPAAFAPADAHPGQAEAVAADGAGAARGGRWYASAEYLLWWFKASPLPAPLLTTTANPSATPTAAFNDPDTTVLLGNQNLGTGAHQGARVTAGLWLDDRRQIAVEGSYFVTASKTTVRSVASDGSPGSAVLAVPFFDGDAGAESSFVIASPGAFAGSAVLSLTSRLQGADLLGAVQACGSDNWHFEVLAGFRFLELTENLTYATASTGLSDPNTDLVLNTVDQFDTRNIFYGFQAGARAEYRFGNFDVGASVKLAMGDMLQRADLNGSAVTNFFNGPAGGPFTGVPTQTLPGSGTFVQPSNQGRVSRDQFAVVPEVGVKIGCQLTPRLRVYAGYDFLYLSNVLRPGEQIDRGINFSQTVQSVIAGNAAAQGTRPAQTFVGSDFWAQGVNLGLEFRY
jgi:hypothetical protein